MSKSAAHRSAPPVAERARPGRASGPVQTSGGVDLLALQRAAGNHAVARLLDAPDVRSARSEAGGAVPPVVRVTLAAGRGQPLPPAPRAAMTPLLGAAVGETRLHTDHRAAASARAIGARAYTVGRDIVFAPGEYAPHAPRGMTLLLHELTHVARAAGTARPDAVYKQAATEPPAAAPTLPPLTVPGTGVTAFPGPTRSASLLGLRLPVPASLRLTNALGVGPGPGWVVDVSPRQLVLHFLDNLDLASTTRAGTPPGRETDPASQQRTSLVRPTITLDPSSGRLRGTATLSVGTEYPEILKSPTELSVEIASTQLGRFSGQIAYGPLATNFNLRLHYDPSRLAQAVRPVADPVGGFEGLWARFQAILRASVPGIDLAGPAEALRTLLRAAQSGVVRPADFAVQTIQLLGQTVPRGANLESLGAALTQLGQELSHPGFTLTGSNRLGPIPLGGYRVEAPTTVPLQRPLAGAPAPFPVRYGAAGVILAPPGAITTTAVPAFGATGGSYGARYGVSGTAAVLPTISPAAISAGQPFANQFPVYAYVEVTGVTRVANGLDLGLRLTVQVSTPELFGTGAAGAQSAEERFRQSLGAYQEGQRGTGAAQPPVPNVGLSVFGTFDGLF